MENIMGNNEINENDKSVIKNDDIIVIKTEKEIFKFRVKEVKVNSCGTFTVDKANRCDAGDFCNIIYKRYSRVHKMGCQNFIFKKQD